MGGIKEIRVNRLMLRLYSVLIDSRGQDLIEYALMAGFVALAAISMVPGITSSMNIVFSKINVLMIQAASS